MSAADKPVTVHSIIFEIENDIHCACDFARAVLTIALHAKSLDADETTALARVAGQAVDHAETVREAWRRLHELTRGTL